MTPLAIEVQLVFFLHAVQNLSKDHNPAKFQMVFSLLQPIDACIFVSDAAILPPPLHF